MKLNQGDTIEVMSNKVDQPNRRGVVQRVLQEDPVEVEVAWEDGHTSTFLPMGGNVRVHSD
jgi:hypothetical protein